MNYLCRGNTKLGDRKVYSFSLPPGVSCPGKSKACEKCYVFRYIDLRQDALDMYKRNLIETRQTGWCVGMNEDLAQVKGKTVRIHVSGDFYSQKYTRDWLGLVKDNPEVTFFCFTRSWMKPGILAILRKMNKQPNCTVWASWDEYMSVPPRGFKRAYMLTRDEPTSRDRRRCKASDLVFRDKGRRKKVPILHRVGGTPVCPLERGKKVNLTCATCKICWR